MTVDQKRVRDVLLNNALLIKVDLVDIINKVDSFSLRTSTWLNDPQSFAAILVFLLVKESKEVSKLIW